MADLSPGATKLLAYWGNIQSAVAARASTADLWNTVRTAAAAEGYDIAPANAIDMGTLRSLAVSNRNAMEALAAAPATAAFDYTMLGTELYARSPAEQALAPLYLVRFEHNVTEDGEPATVWRTDTFRGMLPPTKDELQAQLDADAQLLAEEYTQSHVSIGAISISVA